MAGGQSCHAPLSRTPLRPPHLVDGHARLVVVHTRQHQVHPALAVGPGQAVLEAVKSLHLRANPKAAPTLEPPTHKRTFKNT
eukprot:356780-Chlamydomonas_euryale.AAC.5